MDAYILSFSFFLFQYWDSITPGPYISWTSTTADLHPHPCNFSFITNRAKASHLPLSHRKKTKDSIYVAQVSLEQGDTLVSASQVLEYRCNLTTHSL